MTAKLNYANASYMYTYGDYLPNIRIQIGLYYYYGDLGPNSQI